MPEVTAIYPAEVVGFSASVENARPLHAGTFTSKKILFGG